MSAAAKSANQTTLHCCLSSIGMRHSTAPRCAVTAATMSFTTGFLLGSSELRGREQEVQRERSVSLTLRALPHLSNFSKCDNFTHTFKFRRPLFFGPEFSQFRTLQAPARLSGIFSHFFTRLELSQFFCQRASHLVTLWPHENRNFSFFGPV